MKLGREKDSVVVAETKYYEAPPPETEEEKAAKEKFRKEREEERQRRKEECVCVSNLRSRWPNQQLPGLMISSAMLHFEFSTI